jgi:hypothetical protein
LCSKECSTNCDSTGICQGECNDGWTGEKCSEQCIGKCLKCSKDNGNSCLQCVGNFYSTDCSLACSSSCIVISVKHTCDADGYCLNGCNQTFWGDTCEQPCPGGCKDLKCDRNNGTCTDGCKDGLIGDKCTQTITIGKKAFFTVMNSSDCFITFRITKSIDFLNTIAEPSHYTYFLLRQLKILDFINVCLFIKLLNCS